MDEYIFGKYMPCSCRDDKADLEIGPHVREFEQVWKRSEFWPFKEYTWKCMSCRKVKPGING